MDPIYWPFVFAGGVILGIVLVLLWVSGDQSERADLAELREKYTRDIRATTGWYDPTQPKGQS